MVCFLAASSAPEEERQAAFEGGSNPSASASSFFSLQLATTASESRPSPLEAPALQRQAAPAGGVKAEAKVKSEQVGAAGAAARGGGKQAHTAHTSQPKAAPKEAEG